MGLFHDILFFDYIRYYSERETEERKFFQAYNNGKMESFVRSFFVLDQVNTLSNRYGGLQIEDVIDELSSESGNPILFWRQFILYKYMIQTDVEIGYCDYYENLFEQLVQDNWSRDDANKLILGNSLMSEVKIYAHAISYGVLHLKEIEHFLNKVNDNLFERKDKGFLTANLIMMRNIFQHSIKIKSGIMLIISG